MAKENQKSKGKIPEMDRKEMVKLLNRGYKSLDRALAEIISASEAQNLVLLVDTLELARKIAEVYRLAHLAQLQK